MPAVNFSGDSVLVRAAGTRSDNSIHEYAALKTSGAERRQLRILLKNHSLEYVPPHLARYCGRIFIASAVISAASAMPVWSFQSHAIAAGLLANFFCNASGWTFASTGSGVV